MNVRIGNGFDVHAFAAGRPLVIGGVTVPHDRGLAGHSDADVLLHAIADAILGALAMGDLGRHFPDADPKWKGADSRRLLRQVAAMMQAQRYAIVNADATVIAQAPRLALYSGRGSLHGFVRVAAMRIALNLKRNKAEKSESLSGRNVAAHSDDPEKIVMKKRDAAAFRRAFERAISTLEVDARNVLRLHYVDCLSIEEVATTYKVGRATAARWLAKAKATVMRQTLDELVSSRGRHRGAAEWLEIVESQFGSSLFDCLGGKPRSRR